MLENPLALVEIAFPTIEFKVIIGVDPIDEGICNFTGGIKVDSPLCKNEANECLRSCRRKS